MPDSTDTEIKVRDGCKGRVIAIVIVLAIVLIITLVLLVRSMFEGQQPTPPPKTASVTSSRT